MLLIYYNTNYFNNVLIPNLEGMCMIKKNLLCAALILSNVVVYSQEKSHAEYAKSSSVYNDSKAITENRNIKILNLIQEYRKLSSQQAEERASILSELMQLGVTLDSNGKSFKLIGEVIKIKNDNLQKRKSSSCTSTPTSVASTLSASPSPFSYYRSLEGGTNPKAFSSRCPALKNSRSATPNEEMFAKNAASEEAYLPKLDILSPSSASLSSVMSPECPSGNSIMSPSSTSGSESGTPLLKPSVLQNLIMAATAKK